MVSRNFWEGLGDSGSGTPQAASGSTSSHTGRAVREHRYAYMSKHIITASAPH